MAMLALEYYRSIPRYLLSKFLSSLFPRRFFSWAAPLRLKKVSFTKSRPDWVVLRPRLCGICGSDLNLLRGAESYLLEPYASFPCILGHEVVAEVVEAPTDSGFAPGERVAVEPILACRARGGAPCRFCARGDYNLCEHFTQGELPPGVILGFTHRAGGGLAELMAAPPENLFRLPEHLNDETAVLVDSLASALQPVLDNFPPDAATVVIYGAGIIGQHLVRGLRALGCGARLVMVARYPFQERLAVEGGADLVLLKPSRRQLGEALGCRFLHTTLGGGNLEGGADYFFDCVGSKNSLQSGLLALRARGTLVLVGTAGTVGPVDISSLWFRELRLTGSAMYAYGSIRGERRRTYQVAVDLLAGGNFPAAGLLTHTFSLRQYRQVFQTALDKRRHKCVKVAVDLRHETGLTEPGSKRKFSYCAAEGVSERNCGIYATGFRESAVFIPQR
jgi:threonine dehydrogenase-like Zn-dependent dehydrogenase